jgi:hypothetical protein
MFYIVRQTITAIIIMISFTGCTTFNVGLDFTPEAWSVSSYGIVFISLKEKDPSGQDFRLMFDIRNVGSNNRYTVGYSEVDMLFIEPGLYYIDNVKLITHRSNNVEVRRDLPSPGLDVDGVVQYGAFEVIAKQVYFVGDITYSEKSNEFVQTRNYDSLKSQLQGKEYQVLFDNMKPGKFYKPGSLIYRDNNGHYKISDKKTVK